jgi:prolyl oligopeptidase
MNRVAGWPRRWLCLIGLLAGLMVVVVAPSTPAGSPMMKPTLNYPVTATVNQVDDYHGTTVADPYRWLEDLDAPETKAWIEAQNQVTFGYLNQIPQRQVIQARLTQLWNYEKFGMPFKHGDRYFYYKNDGLQNQSVLYTLKQLDDQPTVLLDPNQLSADGTVALSGISISDNGQYLAYGISQSGSDWQEWQVLDIATGEKLVDRLEWVKFSGASWTKDNQGFFYSRYDAPNPQTQLAAVNYFQKLYYHRLGTAQSADQLIYERPDQKEWGFSGGVTEDGRYLTIAVWKGTDSKNLLFYKDLTQPESPVVELVNQFEASFDVVDNDGTTFWVQTDLAAPRRRLMAIDTANPDRENWREVIPEGQETLEGVNVLNDQFIATYLQDARSVVKLFDLQGQLVKLIPLPGIGSVGGFDGKRSDVETFFSFTGFTVPKTIYRYNVATGEQSIFRQPTIAFDGSQYETQQVFYASKDGTKVPMFITHKKGLKLDGNNPTLLYAYGGFNASMTPAFSITNTVWLEQGGVYAVANLRGGGEYGEAWHQAGMKANKQNVFDDFIAAAEWLIANQYTSSSKLAIEGGSNGGLLVGACMVQRPELFAAALPAVGVMDMLRFHKFTIGWAWTAEYGSPDDAADFPALYAYSPLHNLKKGTHYPATMITTADHDDRVVPAHSFKFAAALQAAHKGENPVLIRIATKAGHGAGKPTAKVIEEAADKWAFLIQTLGVK